uniref:Uncharacterized protein n=1 Tax=Glossina pallidipes TaxID=7398 RepID=A0A1B0AE03_GLOPL
MCLSLLTIFPITIFFGVSDKFANVHHGRRPSMMESNLECSSTFCKELADVYPTVQISFAESLVRQPLLLAAKAPAICLNNLQNYGSSMFVKMFFCGCLERLLKRADGVVNHIIFTLMPYPNIILYIISVF